MDTSGRPVFHDKGIDIKHPPLVSFQYVIKLFIESVVLEPVDITLRNQLLLLIHHLLQVSLQLLMLQK